ncbi:hypothetical protein MML48_1g01449 [Holotrichia oblita]|uniref:Uncharacterized protein n=1 Tax=Holotrichia oblita TaxID=644536 RepID=A0ACB9TV53_HOLOL|nr:hypothetical protein MML48_1g01449 [Holotrichia oblita]
MFADNVVVKDKNQNVATYITPCKRYAPDISQCWESTLLQLRPHFKDGIPEFDLPPVSTLQVNQVHLDQDNTANVNFIADLYNITFSGADNFDVVYTNADFKALVLEEGLAFPKLAMRADYKAKGKVLLFEFEGEGKATGEYGKTDFEIDLEPVLK